MADASILSAVANGSRLPLIFGAISNARAQVNQLIATKQIADRSTMVALLAVNAIKSPNNINLVV